MVWSIFLWKCEEPPPRPSPAPRERGKRGCRSWTRPAIERVFAGHDLDSGGFDVLASLSRELAPVRANRRRGLRGLPHRPR